MVALYASYVGQPTMPLKDLFTGVVDLLYKVRLVRLLPFGCSACPMSCLCKELNPNSK